MGYTAISPRPLEARIEGSYTPDDLRTSEVESLSDISHLSALYGDLDRRLEEAIDKGDNYAIQKIAAEVDDLEERMGALIAKPSSEQPSTSRVPIP